MRKLREALTLLAIFLVAMFAGVVYGQNPNPKPVTFEWDCPTCGADEVEQFVFYESTVSGDLATGNFQVVAIIPADQAAEFPTEIPLNTGRHWFYVTGQNWAGESPPSNIVTVLTQLPRSMILRKRTAG